MDGYFVGNFLGLNDSWVEKNKNMIFLSKNQVLELFNDFEIVYFKEIEKDSKTAFGVEKHWHIYEIIAQKNDKIQTEKVDVYNKYREKINVIKERNKLNKGEYRISTHIWIKNKQNKILVVKRAKQEDIFPGMWAQVGGGVISGNTSKETVFKECKEKLDLNIDEDNLFYIGSYTRTSDIVDIWMVEQDVDIAALNLKEDEVADAKFVSFDEFDEMIEDGVVVPSINPSYYLMKNYDFNY